MCETWGLIGKMSKLQYSSFLISFLTSQKRVKLTEITEDSETNIRHYL